MQTLGSSYGYIRTYWILLILSGCWVCSLCQDQDNFYFDPSPVGGEVKEGEEARLRCDVSNRKMIVFYWTLNDSKVVETPRRFLEQGDLRILRVDRVLDSGSFRCVATNISTGMALRSTEAKLNVLWISKQVEVQMKTQREGEEVVEGGEVLFKCQVEGHTEPTVEWFKNKFRIFATTRVRIQKNRLKLSTATSADNGVYSCVARNEAGTVESENNYLLNVPGRNTARLDVGSFTGRQLVRRGGEARLNCSFTGSTRTEWYFNENRIIDIGDSSPQNKYSILSNGTLVVRNIKQEDAGSYHCTGVSERGPVQSFTSDLLIASDNIANFTWQDEWTSESNLDEPEQEVFEPGLSDLGYVVVQVGGKLEILCRAPRGLPTPEVRWLGQDGRLIGGEAERVRSVNGMLTISDSTGSDTGNYTCVMGNIAGNFSKMAWIVISVPPVISRPPLSIRVSEDDVAVFECRTQATPYPVTVVDWMKEYEHIDNQWTYAHSLPQESRMRVDQMTGSLTIENVTLGDEGNYACVVSTTGHPPITSTNAHLYVEKRLKFKPDLVDTNLELGSRLEVKCEADGRVPPVVKWYREGEEIRGVGEVQGVNGSLVFRNVQREHAGRYTCRASNEQGVISATITIRVVVSPKFKIRPQNSTALEGSALMLHCVAHGDPNPAIEWNRNGVANSFDQRRFKVLSNGSLSISEVYMEDVGKYGCKASNLGGSQRVEINIFVTNSLEQYERMKEGERPLYTDDYNMMKTIVIAVCSAVAYLAVVIGLTAYCIIRLVRNMNLRKQRQLESNTGNHLSRNGNGSISSKLNGNKDYDVIDRGDMDCRSLLSATGPTNTTHLSSPSVPPPPLAGTLSRNHYHRLAFPRSQLQTLGMLGKGHYGDVFLARANGITNGQPDCLVMVKSLLSHSEELSKEFRREMEIFGRANHQHIVKLLGVCREMEPFFLITEYCEWGDLKKFLLATRSDDLPNSGMHVAPLNLRQKVTICGQVALAMEHLSSSGLVHRDLAARNVLLSPSLDIKVGCPALSRDVYINEYYQLHPHSPPIAIRWAAPEAVLDDDWSAESDVWAFGVFAWEIFSTGELPLGNRTDLMVVEGIERRENRLMCPLGCIQELWSLIQTCLVYNADVRPSFSDIVTLLYDISTDNLYSN